MTIIDRAFAFGCSLFADDFGGSPIRMALLIGLSVSAILVLVRVGTAIAGAAH